MKKLCVFDLDGTLVDSIADIAAALNHALGVMHREPHPVEAYYRMVGDGMELLCRRAMGAASQEETDRLIALYQKEYLANCCVRTRPYPGIPELLEALKAAGYLLAVLSNKPQEQTQEVVGTLFPGAPFFMALGQSPRFPKKPEPDSMLYLLEQAGADREETWYIGDSDVDVQLGQRAGVETVGVSWGFRGNRELREAGASRIAEDAAALGRILLEK